jgi:hypothetical protein
MRAACCKGTIGVCVVCTGRYSQSCSRHYFMYPGDLSLRSTPGYKDLRPNAVRKNAHEIFAA